jgi:hypothetical protein
MRHFVRFGSTALGIALAGLTAWATFGASGCVVTTTDDTDSGVTDDTGTTGDTANPGTTGGIRVKASSLIGTADSDVTGFGGGSTYAQIVAGKIAYAKAKITSGPGGVGTEFPSGMDATGHENVIATADGAISGLPAGDYEIQVKGYLRGVIADADATPDTRIFIAQSTCTVTVAVDTTTDATCTPLQLSDSSGNHWIKGIIFPSDFVGPSGGAAYALTTSGKDMDVWRARTPTSGNATASVAESDAEGVVFIDEAKFKSIESTSARETKWSLWIEPKNTSVAVCTTAPGCTVTRIEGGAAVDLVVVNPATGDHAKCIVNAANTGSTGCFQP